MNKVTVVFLMVLMGTVFLSADIYIREKEHIDAYQAGIKKTPAREGENEIWVGKYRAVYITPAEIYIYDKKMKKVRFVNRREKTYVEADVPLDLSRLYSRETAARMKTFKVRGTARRTDKTRTILNKKCTAYKLHYWVDAGGSKYIESKGMLWVYEDIGPGFAVFNELMELIRLRDNRDEAFRREMQKAGGVQMRSDITHTQQGISIGTWSEVIELSKKDPPAGVYEVPGGYTLKEAL
jgi:hypothetical protein